jgi:hypothetical protein
MHIKGGATRFSDFSGKKKLLDYGAGNRIFIVGITEGSELLDGHKVPEQKFNFDPETQI